MTFFPDRFPPTRSAGIARLAAFVPLAAHDYAAGRNTDYGPDAPSAVSKLSPYLRYRMLTEQEVVAAILDRHGHPAAEKYVQEVLWRTYWKGWLELRPAIWDNFLEERDRQQQTFPNARALAAAENGLTGIDGFDAWAHELVATGYLHNHARMWFASIWIFTLRLPWALGADFFLRHLLDADAASNTLSWRWVAGLQTVGKTYLATKDNIARYSNGRFAPVGLAAEAVALREPPIAAARAMPELRRPKPGTPALLLVTTDDLHAESLALDGIAIDAAIIAADPALLWGDKARAFVGTAAADCAARTSAHFGCPADTLNAIDTTALVSAARAAGVGQIVTAYAPVGPVADALRHAGQALAGEGVSLVQLRRPWDQQFWPHANKGFFPFKEQIPVLLRTMGSM